MLEGATSSGAVHRRFDAAQPSHPRPELCAKRVPLLRTRSAARLPLSTIALLGPAVLSIMVVSAGNSQEGVSSSGSVSSRKGASDALTFIFRPSCPSNPAKGPSQAPAAKSASSKRDCAPHASRAASLHAGAAGGAPGQKTDERKARCAADPEEVQTGKSWLLLRHGQTNFNAEGRIQGSTDFSRLSEEGARQAKEVGKFLAGLKIDTVYVSPLARAQQTLEIAEASGRRLPPASVVQDLREIDLHEWEGMLKKEIQLRYPELYNQWRGGGSPKIRDLWARASGVWKRLLKEAAADVAEGGGSGPGGLRARRTLVTGHNGINQAMLCAAAGLDENFFRKLEFANCGVAEVIWNPGEARARRWRWLYPAKSVWVEVPEEGTAGGIMPAPIMQSEADATPDEAREACAEEQGL
ncbi:histidine phosphatase superfamily [Baffinella frigidus]|nr:histidine phosphatase superfamily [Cryptophyta sp. CCMP2293]